MKRVMRICVWEGSDGQHYWHIRARNGKIVCHGEGHPSKGKAIRAARGVVTTIVRSMGDFLGRPPRFTSYESHGTTRITWS